MLDITERKAAEEQVAYLAYHDKLTGLPNRAMFDELLELSIARARRNGLGVAVISVDLDDFKLVNDSLGHEVGDELILELAERLREATRDTDLVARPGGDEFLVLLADLDPTPPVPGGGPAVRWPPRRSRCASRTRCRRRSRSRAPSSTSQRAKASACSRTTPATPATLLKNADTAMFRVKKIGPGGYVVHTPGRGDAMSRLSMSTRLRKAVEQKQWMLHYQPLIELDDRDDVRRRGTDPVARAERRARAARRVHPARRGDGADRGDRRLGRRGDLPPGRAMAGRGPRAGGRLQPVPRQLWQPELVDKIVSRRSWSPAWTRPG